jgi:hypothetical protein
MRVPLDLCRPVLLNEPPLTGRVFPHTAQTTGAAFLNHIASSHRIDVASITSDRGYIGIHVADARGGTLRVIARRYDHTHGTLSDGQTTATTAFSTRDQVQLAMFDSSGLQCRGM